jgi:hypothetical protein
MNLMFAPTRRADAVSAQRHRANHEDTPLYWLTCFQHGAPSTDPAVPGVVGHGGGGPDQTDVIHLPGTPGYPGELVLPHDVIRWADTQGLLGDDLDITDRDVTDGRDNATVTPITGPMSLPTRKHAQAAS